MLYCSTYIEKINILKLNIIYKKYLEKSCNILLNSDFERIAGVRSLIMINKKADCLC